MPTKSLDSVMCDVCVVFVLVGGDLIGNRRFRTHDLPGETQIGQGADNMSRFSGWQTHFHLEDTSRTHMMMGICIRRAGVRDCKYTRRQLYCDIAEDCEFPVGLYIIIISYYNICIPSRCQTG